MRFGMVWLVASVILAGQLPRFELKIVTEARSPDRKLVAWTTREEFEYNGQTFGFRRLYVAKVGEPKSNGRRLIYGRYSGIDSDNGVRYFQWSQDSKYLVFDFGVNRSAHYDFEGLGFLGMVEVATGSGWFLPERGCQPKFKNKDTIEFLSYDDTLNSGTAGTPVYRSPDNTVYLHTTPVKRNTNPRFVFRPGSGINFDIFEMEFWKLLKSRSRI